MKRPCFFWNRQQRMRERCASFLRGFPSIKNGRREAFQEVRRQREEEFLKRQAEIANAMMNARGYQHMQMLAIQNCAQYGHLALHSGQQNHPMHSQVPIYKPDLLDSVGGCISSLFFP